MGTNEKHLYKVYAKGWNSKTYVAADNQQQAVEKVANAYEGEDPSKMTVEYIDEIII